MIFESPTLTISANGTIPDVPFLDIKEAILGKKYDLSISFVGPKNAQRLNKEYRNKEYIPNTLSFPLTETSGELFICRTVAHREWHKFCKSYDDYIIFLTIHSMLHLKGFDHGSTMESKETFFMNRFAHTHNHEATNIHRH
ncbi:MAG: rRNA maturation RNase YbeY [bacterium]